MILNYILIMTLVTGKISIKILFHGITQRSDSSTAWAEQASWVFFPVVVTYEKGPVTPRSSSRPGK